MRSRYVAYVMKLEHYVLSTWHESKRPATLNTHSSSEPAVAPRFFRLEVKAHTVSKPGTASVEFIALYKSGGRAVRMHEVSHFVFEHGQWWYVDGEVSDH